MSVDKPNQTSGAFEPWLEREFDFDLGSFKILPPPQGNSEQCDTGRTAPRPAEPVGPGAVAMVFNFPPVTRSDDHRKQFAGEDIECTVAAMPESADRKAGSGRRLFSASSATLAALMVLLVPSAEGSDNLFQNSVDKASFTLRRILDRFDDRVWISAYGAPRAEWSKDRLAPDIRTAQAEPSNGLETAVPSGPDPVSPQLYSEPPEPVAATPMVSSPEPSNSPDPASSLGVEQSRVPVAEPASAEVVPSPAATAQSPAGVANNASAIEILLLPPEPPAIETVSRSPEPAIAASLPESPSHPLSTLTPAESSSAAERLAELTAAIAAERKAALERERERVDALARELALVREELAALKSGPGISWSRLPLQALPLGPEDAEIDSGSGREESGPGRDHEPGTALGGDPGREPPSGNELRLPSMVGALPPPVRDLHPNPSLSSSDEKRLLDRAQALLNAKDISGARLLLERGVEVGSRQAIFLLAQTYDQRVLDRWRIVGVAGDEARASALYARASAGFAGVSETSAVGAEVRR